MQAATVAIEGSDAYEAGDLPPVEAAELRQSGQEGTAGAWADALDGPQDFILDVPSVAGLNRAGKLLVDLCQLLVEEFDDRVARSG